MWNLAILQGKSINRDNYLKPQKEAGTRKLWKLKITIYGLYDAPRVWYLSVKKVLQESGAKKNKPDDSVFYWHKNGKLQGSICCLVNDFVLGETKEFEINVINKW